MRNGVLGVMGEILLKVLSKDSLEDKLKDTRDQFLEKLEVRLTTIRAVTLDLFCSYCTCICGQYKNFNKKLHMFMTSEKEVCLLTFIILPVTQNLFQIVFILYIYAYSTGNCI